MSRPIFVLFIVLLSASLGHSAHPVLESLFTSSHEREGDYDSLAREWIELLAAQPQSPYADVVVDRLDEIAQDLRDPQAIVEPLRSVLEDVELPPMISRRARALLATVLSRLGREDESRSLDANRGYLQHWVVLGPLGLGLESELDQTFAAETTYDPGSPVSTPRGERHWVPLPPIHPERFIDARQLFSGNGVYLHVAQVRSDEDRPILLHLHSHSRAWVRVNDVPVLQDVGDAFRTRPVRLLATLSKGWNRIVVKVSRPGFSLLVTDRSGNPLGSDLLESETAPRAHPIQAGSSNPAGDSSAEPIDPKYPLDWREFNTQYEKERQPLLNAPLLTALPRLALAWRARFLGRPDLCAHYVERALKATPDHAAVHYQAGVLFRGIRHLPAKYRRRRARAAFERAVQIDAEYLTARIRLADYHQRDEEASVAIEILREVIESRSDCLPALELSLRIFDSKGWRRESMVTAKRLADTAPGSALAYRTLAQHTNERRDVEATIRLYREALARDARQYTLYETVAFLERDRGHLDRALELLERARDLRPGHSGPLLALADLYQERGDWQRALEVLRPLEKRAFGSARILRRIAALLEESGELDEARKMYRRIVDRFPGELEMARYLERLDGDEATDTDRFWVPYDEILTAEDLTDIPSGDAYPEADSLAVLDIAVLEIRPDGTTSEYIHQAMKVLSEASEENLARVRTVGEVIELRTLRPDGTELEPVPALGQDSFVMPGLEPGAVIEYAYRHDSDTFDGWMFRAGPFYFQDFNFRQPFLLTRYVLLVPPDFDVDVIERGFVSRKNFADVQRSESELPNGGRAIVYEAQSAPRMRPEVNMPHRDDYIPNVHLMQTRGWNDVAGWFTDVTRGAARLTPALEEFARSALKDAGGNELDQARALYELLQELVKTDQGPRDANGILLERAGNRTVLYKALLDAAGVPSSWAFARPRPGILAQADFSHPSPDGFSSQLVALNLPGREKLWVTLDQRKTPFGKLPYYLQGGTAIVLRPGGAALEVITHEPPSSKSESLDAKIALGRDASSPLAAEVSLSMTSRDYSSCSRKTVVEGLDTHRRELYLQQFAAGLFPGARVSKSLFKDVESVSSPLRLEIDLVAPEYLSRTGDDLLVRSVIQPLQLVQSLIRGAEREHPYLFPRQLIRKDTMEIDLGEHFSVSHLPTGALELCPLGSYALRFIVDGSRVLVEREVRLDPGSLDAKDHPRLIAFCRAVDEAESARIVLHSR